jgi:hypothetical protein
MRCIALLSPSSRGVEASWLLYRAICKRYQLNKVYVTGLRYLIATAFLPGTPLSLPDLPNITANSKKISYAIARASVPSDMLSFFTQPPNSAVQATWTWGIHRGKVCEAILDTFLRGSEQLRRGEYVIPIHSTAAMVLEAAKVLMEMEAGSMMIGRMDPKLQREHPIPTWLFTMQQISGIMRDLGSTSEGYEGDIGDSRGESILNGCSNLLGSMVRSANEWYKPLDQGSHSAAELEVRRPPDLQGGQQHLNANVPPGSIPIYPNLMDQTYDNVPSVPGPSHSHQAYMHTSDRWMAADPQGEVGQSAGPQQGQMAPGQSSHPTPLDLLLSQMFNYHSIPGHTTSSTDGVGHASAAGGGTHSSLRIEGLAGQTGNEAGLNGNREWCSGSVLGNI